MHVITVGSLGTLTINVMALTWTLKARAGPARVLTVSATLLIATATVARLLSASDVGDPRWWLLAAASCWSAAFALLLIRLARIHTR
jgi:uncharacterized protein involved in response to NO